MNGPRTVRRIAPEPTYRIRALVAERDLANARAEHFRGEAQRVELELEGLFRALGVDPATQQVVTSDRGGPRAFGLVLSIATGEPVTEPVEARLLSTDALPPPPADPPADDVGPLLSPVTAQASKRKASK